MELNVLELLALLIAIEPDQERVNQLWGQLLDHLDDHEPTTITSGTVAPVFTNPSISLTDIRLAAQTVIRMEVIDRLKALGVTL